MRLVGLVLMAATDDLLAGIAHPERHLSEAEHARFLRFRHDADRNDYLAAHLLVRMCAGELVGTPFPELELVQECPTCGGAHGPPRILGLSGVGVSLSHSGGWVAAAAGSKPIGVDIEALAAAPVGDGFWRDAELILTGSEARFVRASSEPAAAFLDLWVRKEALVKAGRARLDTLTVVDLVGDTNAVATRWGDLELTPWRGRGGTLGACASPAPATLRLVERWDRALMA